MLRCELRVLDRVCFGADFFISLKCCGAALSPWYCGCVAGAILERFIAVGCCAVKLSRLWFFSSSFLVPAEAVPLWLSFLPVAPVLPVVLLFGGSASAGC